MSEAPNTPDELKVTEQDIADGNMLSELALHTNEAPNLIAQALTKARCEGVALAANELERLQNAHDGLGKNSTANIDYWRDKSTEAEAQLTTLRQRVAELEGALRWARAAIPNADSKTGKYAEVREKIDQALSNTGEAVGVKVKALKWARIGKDVWCGQSGEFEHYIYREGPSYRYNDITYSTLEEPISIANANHIRRVSNALDLSSTTTGEE